MEIFLGGVGGPDWRGGGPESAIETGLTLGGWIMRRKRKEKKRKRNHQATESPFPTVNSFCNNGGREGICRPRLPCHFWSNERKVTGCGGPLIFFWSKLPVCPQKHRFKWQWESDSLNIKQELKRFLQEARKKKKKEEVEYWKERKRKKKVKRRNFSFFFSFSFSSLDWNFIRIRTFSRSLNLPLTS